MPKDETLVHLVDTGEHLYDIAVRYGVAPADIWGHDANKTLHAGGRTPEQLAAGDIVYVPKQKRKFLAVKVGSTTKFEAKIPSVTVSFSLTGAGGKPLAGEAYEVLELGKSGSSDGAGTVTLKDVPLKFKLLHVRLTDQHRTLKVKVGHLDPVTTLSGFAQRLTHLGYLEDAFGKLTTRALTDAVRRFVAAEAPNATTPEAIQKAVKDAHGM